MSGQVFDKDALIQYRLEQAKETLLDARVLYEHERRPASIVNRAYYAMFEARQEGDYTNPDLIDREKAADILKAAGEFLKAIEEKLAKGKN